MFHLRIFLLIFFISAFSDCQRTTNKMYVDLTSVTGGCFRNLNATHQIGCSSALGGNVGVLHYIESHKDLEWVLSDGPTAPFVVLMQPLDFNLTTVMKLVNSKRVNGILLINSMNYTQPAKFSADHSCPNDAYGLYHNSSEYSKCQQVTWNKAGNGIFFKDFGISMFVVDNVTDLNHLIVECYEKFNKPVDGKVRSYPLCAIQLKEAMDGAKDSVTCIRRSSLYTNLNDPKILCDSLGDKNVIATIKTVSTNVTNDYREPDSVIVVGTQMDSFSMFFNEFMSSDNTVTGIVSLLAIAEALGKVRTEISNDPKAKDIMFAFFQGESWDYIGSSRMLYEMEKGRFPSKLKDGIRMLKLINITHVSHFVELRQLGLRDEGKLWIHSDPLSRRTGKIDTEIGKMISILKEAGSAASVAINDTGKTQPLPPASVQRFLMKRALPAIVVTDHKKAYTNQYFNSRLDLPQFINASSDHYDNVTEQSEELTKLSTAIARMLYKLSTGKDASDSLSVDPMTVAHLLFCFQHPPHCELFNQSVDEIDLKVLQEIDRPFPFYVSVAKNTNHITYLTQKLLAQYIGDKVPDKTKDTCKVDDNDKNETCTYLWMQGSLNGTKREGWCIRSTAQLSDAESPVFLSEMSDYDWNSGVYSTWTESTWTSFEVRMFLIPSEQFKTTVLSLGVIITLCSFLLVYFINKNSNILFLQCGSPRYYTY
ncbi:nicastrin-like isoform X2 [Gigantopelta aegis]|uniref:nicastrin-like isoform X2 n=1 Tax=Gigantopelta aegis TaxID=1735272 RepID=UPI001B887EE6|nr:nicastrin-like isoform X2 [Gigantopelta aegis]